MNNFDPNYKKKILLLIGGFALVIIVLFTAIIYRINKSDELKNSTTTLTTTPTPAPVRNIDEIKEPENGSGFGDQASTNLIDRENRGFLIGELILKLPYEGNDFTLSYNAEDDLFDLYINSANRVQGEAEFESFLKENGIASKTWITNIQNVNSPTN